MADKHNGPASVSPQGTPAPESDAPGNADVAATLGCADVDAVLGAESNTARLSGLDPKPEPLAQESSAPTGRQDAGPAAGADAWRDSPAGILESSGGEELPAGDFVAERRGATPTVGGSGGQPALSVAGVPEVEPPSGSAEVTVSPSASPGTVRGEAGSTAASLTDRDSAVADGGRANDQLGPPPDQLAQLGTEAKPPSTPPLTPSPVGTTERHHLPLPADATSVGARVGDAQASSDREPDPTSDEVLPSADRSSQADQSTIGELEDLELPSLIPALDPLPEGATADIAGLVIINKLVETRGRVNRYRATWSGPGEPCAVELQEAPADHAGLRREAEVLSQVRYNMLPRLLGSWERDGRRYLATEWRAGRTLDAAFADGITTEELLSVALQIAQTLRRLHQAGWALLGLAPESVTLGQPITLGRLGSAVRIGETPAEAMLAPGYAAPELAHRAPISGKEDVYALGALLYRGFAGAPVSEDGAGLPDLATSVNAPGVPQLLAAALAPADERVDLEGLYQALLALRARRSLAPLALRVASGTSIGLNETRVTNEDACGYLTWCSTYEGRVVYNAVLCEIDGMGGMEAGEVAATSALRAALHGAAVYAAEQIAGAAGSDQDAPAASAGASSGPEEPLPRRLEPSEMVQAAAAACYAAARGRQVGATITLAVIQDGQLTLGHVGDTRAYMLRDGVLTQLSRDHSLVATMVASGVITKEEAQTHPDRNKVLRSLGGLRQLPDGYIDSLAVAYNQEVLQLRDGDQLLLCSDGVWGVLDDATLRNVLTDSPDGETAVRSIMQRVIEGGAPDNATAIVARCVVMPAT